MDNAYSFFVKGGARRRKRCYFVYGNVTYNHYVNVNFYVYASSYAYVPIPFWNVCIGKKVLPMSQP
ncbi:hypothetical protein DASC09_042890 [Saccharomycopsis crataegensis]|uniref:Uncharacterized protein n=1 Tax=Saccharomycopsis crataegensis TaxID=43959 RepID=A0AAV5QQH8_9ASCO|nr:hypothetical protein DASC09_042890 [Saccharomycopsis crataegensis]